MASGTITGTGPTEWVYGKDVDIIMGFAGTASVDIEVRMVSGTAVKFLIGVTGNYIGVVNSAVVRAVRLNCTAHTDNVEWELIPGP